MFNVLHIELRPARDDFAKKIAALFFRLLRDRLLGLAGEGGGRLRRADPATKVVPAKRLQGQGRSGAGQKNTLASVSGKTNRAVLVFSQQSLALLDVDALEFVSS